MLSQLAVRAARPEAIRQKCAGERALREGLAQGRSEAIPKGVRGSGKAAYSRGGIPSASRRPAAPRARRVRRNPVSRVPEREEGAMRATRFPDRASASQAEQADARAALRAAGTPCGLYDPALEKDSCGVGFIADIKGRKSHKIVDDALKILLNLEHRGAVGADPRAGDGAGILVQIPHAFFARKTKELGFGLPQPGAYAVGALFMPKETAWRKVIKSIITDQIKAEQLTLLGWRDVPTDNSSLGQTVKPTEPAHMQVFIGRGAHIKSDDEFERRLYILRKSISQAIYQRRDRGLAGYYPVSMSCRTVIYKGMFLADQLGKYYPDLSEPDFESALALVHQRFSTNTFPTG